MRVGDVVIVDGWRKVVVCDVRDHGYYTTSGDNRREYFPFKKEGK